MPMKYPTPRDQQMNARTSLKDKITIQENGYTAADGLAYFAEELRNSNPRKKIAIKKRMIDIKLEGLKKLECEIQSEIEQLELQREKLNSSVKPSDDTLELLHKMKDAKVDLPPNLKEAVKRVQNAFDRKRDLFVSGSKSDVDLINEFIEKHDEFILTTYNSHGSGLDWRDFKELLLNEIVV